PAPTTELIIRPSESPDVIIPIETPTPTSHEFDVDDVIMQSTPGSSCFSEIGYDSDYNILVVQFRDSGSVYMYLDFSIDEWDKFTSADSLGRWYNKHIKNKYECERIN
ncbi:MAG: KTSC domain-containing protein, partial [Bacillota bacterium]